MSSPQAAPIDLTRLEETADGDPEFVAELVEIFVDDAHEQIRQIQKAIQGSDAIGLECRAHQLKGSSANVGADGMSNWALRLEEAGKSGSELEAEFERVCSHLKDILG
jgi:HPt (histidine-containing phosphotransfer) domain-containing protein